MNDHDDARAPTRPRQGPVLRCLRPAFVAAAIALPLLAQAGCLIETVEMPVTIAGGRAIATVGINGTPVPLTVDSGASLSMLTDAAAAQLKLPLKRNPYLRAEGITGRIDTHTTTVDKLRLFKGDIGHAEFVVGGNEPGAGTMGLMGRNILGLADTEYDLAHGVIRIVYPNDDCARSSMAYWAGATPVTEVELIDDYNSKVPAIRANVKLNGNEFLALFDTGAHTVVSAKAAKRAGVAESDLKEAGTMYGAGRGTAKLWIAPFPKFELGGEAISNNRLRVGDFDLPDADLLLGIDFFLSHRIYVSKQQSRLFVTYNGGPVFALNRTDTAAAEAIPTTDTATAATADQLARRAASSAARRDFEGALADLDRACELEPTKSAWFAQRGALQAALKRPARAREDFDRALTLDPTQVDALFGRAVLRFNAKDRDGAKVDLDALDHALAPQAQMRLAMSQLYLGLEEPAKTIAQLNQWLPAHPHEIGREVALNRRCWARATLGVELEQALSDCDDAIDADTKNASYLDSRGWVYLRLGKFDNAVSDFDHSIEYRPANAWSLYGRGLARTRLGDVARGEADLVEARKVLADIDGKIASVGLMTGLAPRP